MEYEKKYKEALKWMQKLYPSFEGWVKEDAEHYFPELKENEDERIRKAIIAYISHGQHCGVSNADMIAWLEKQERALNPDKVIEWLENKQSSIDLYNKFRKDFRI